MLIEFPLWAGSCSLWLFQQPECGLIGANWLVGNDKIEIHWEADDRSTLQLGIFLANNNLWWFHLSLQQHVLRPQSLHNYAMEMYLKLLKWLYIGRICSSIWCILLKSPHAFGLPLKCAFEIGVCCSQFSAEKQEGFLYNLKAIMHLEGGINSF